jgi:hypothetical protein
VPQYPLYTSPDGQHQQFAPSRSRQVQLEHAGWRRTREPRKKKTGGDLSRWKKPATD